MHQVLLVDNEPAVTDSLCYGIDWNSMGLSVAAIARSGNQALEIIRSQPIQIVISDIRMADLDGLSLCQQISQMRQQIQIILISGFAEFSYAQKALSYGVIGYCLKPLEYEELKLHLRHAVRNLENTSYDIKCDNLLNALYGKNECEIKNCLAELGMYSDQYYLAASVSKYPLPTQSGHQIALRLGRRVYGYLSTLPYRQERLEQMLDKICCKGCSFFSHPISITQLFSSLKSLTDRAYCFFFSPSLKIVHIAKSEKADIEIRKIASVLEHGDTSKLVLALEDLSHIPSDLLSLMDAWQIYNLIASSDLYGPLVATDDIYSPEHLVYQYDTFQNMLSVLRSRLQCAAESPNTDSISNSTFLSMLSYINEHINEDCSLKNLAAEMDMNANYLGQVFKRETGKNYTTYILELKIEKAKAMIDSRDFSISEIASALGFNDYFYFLKSFKRITGFTPKQYSQGNTMENLLFSSEFS